MKFISTLLAAVLIIPPSAAVVDIFVQHDNARDVLYGRNEAIVVNEEVPAITENVAVVTLCEGVERAPKYNATETELEQLVTLCYLEAGGESDAVIRCIAEVVFNRLASDIWGETLTDVIYAPGEFDAAPYIAEFETDGNLIIEDKLDEIRDIVWDVYYSGVSIPERVMFFRTDYYHGWEGAVDEFAVGNVYFSSSRWCEG